MRSLGWFGATSGGPDEQQGEDRERHGDPCAAAAPGSPASRAAPCARRAGGATATTRTRRPTPRAAASAARRRACMSRPGQDVGRRDRQHDPLRRGDDLAPAARRQRRAHPRQQPLAEEEQVARRADREHPRAEHGRDVDAEGEDQERVDLAVEARAQRGRRPGAPRDPAVDQVQRERDGGERHEQRDRRARARTSPRPARRRRRRAWPGRASPTTRPCRAPGGARGRAPVPPPWWPRTRGRRPSRRRRARRSRPGRRAAAPGR